MLVLHGLADTDVHDTLSLAPLLEDILCRNCRARRASRVGTIDTTGQMVEYVLPGDQSVSADLRLGCEWDTAQVLAWARGQAWLERHRWSRSSH